uniref:Chloride channel protein n=1 Tax=Enterobius vermicularis TaxID=51028 RepID=A0A0N4VDM2_ENTVE
LQPVSIVYHATHKNQSFYLFFSSLDENEDPVTGLERVASYSSIDAEERRQRRLQQEQRLAQREEARRKQEEEVALSARYESLDYEIVENQLYRSEEKDPNHQQILFRQSVNRWAVCFFIGVVTGAVAAFIDILIYYSGRVKFHYIISNYLVLKLCEKQLDNGGGCVWMVELAWISYNCFLVSISACLVLFVAPVAAASGIPQVKCFLNGVQIPGVVRLKTLIVKAIGVACSVGGGLSAGKEGPMIHSGAVVAAGISQGRCISLPLDFHVFEQFRNDREKRDFVSAGAAAGVAAAFGAPIGGVLFSLEEGASFWNQNLTWRMFFAAMISSFTVNLILSVFYGVSGFLSWTGLANFGVFENIEYNIWEIPIFLFIGVMGGLLGSFFNLLSVRLMKFRQKYVTTPRQRLFECLLVAAVSAFTGFLTLFVVDDCRAIGVNPELTELNKLWCRKGEYSAVANLFFQSPEESVKSLFHSPINSFRASTLFIFAIEYFILTLWTYGLSVPSGIFIPSILTGAAWGRLVGIGVESLFPNVTGVDPGKYALAGAAAQLGGIVRMTLSLTAIIMEATKDITFGLPLMLVLMISKWVGDIFNKGLYDSQIELAEVPFLGWNPPKLSRNILAEQVMRKDVVAMEPLERVSRILEILRTTQHHGFPVVDQINPSKGNNHLPDYGHIKGLILRSQLITLLQNRNQTDEIRYDRWLEKVRIATDEENCWVDLRRYLHPHPHRVPLNTSLQSIFTLFRGLGLRYLIVTDDENNVRGVITRKDIARFKEQRKIKRYSIRELFVSDFNG